MAPKSHFTLKKSLFGVEVRWLDAISKRLADPRAMLKKIGIYIVGQTQQAFANQGLPGEPKWRVRYPNQSDPVLNIAGVVSDFIKGRKKIKAFDFQRRPVLRRSGNLMNWWDSKKGMSIKGRYVVEVGTSGSIAKYAGLMQWGGKSPPLMLSDDVKERIEEAIGKFRGERNKARDKGGYRQGMGTVEYKVAKERANAVNKLGSLLKKDKRQLVTTVVPRPFLLITKKAENEIRRILENDIPGDPLTRYLEGAPE